MTEPALSSRACESCRKRKIKCDRRLPSCTQCTCGTRATKRCLYRQACLELSLRDQTKKVASRQINQEQYQASDRSPQHSSKDGAPENSLTRVLQQEKNIVSFLPINLASAVGTNILLTRFQHGVYHQYLPAIYLSSTSSAVLRISIEAVGLVCLSFGRNDGQLMMKAKEKHIVALRSTSRVLTHTANTVSPHAMAASILLLALFAVMSPDNPHARETWTSHVDGAYTLLTTWHGIQKYPEASSLPAENLVRHVVNCMQLSHFQQRKHLPPQMQKLYGVLAGIGVQARLHTVINGLADMHLKMRSTRSDCTQEVQVLDAEIVSALAMLEQMHPFTIARKSTKQSNEPICYEYTSHRACQSWNFVRVVRLRLNQKLLAHLTRTQLTYLETTSTGARLKRGILSKIASTTFDICASVPAYLRPASFFHSRTGTFSAASRPDLIHWAHSLIWPLAIAQAAPNAPGMLSEFVDDTIAILWQAARFPDTTLPEKQFVERIPIKDW